jgi:putative nucleotidyltransferase with HDIG domain
LKKDAIPVVVNMSLYPVFDICKNSIVSIYVYIDNITPFFCFKKFFEDIVTNAQKADENSMQSIVETAIDYEHAKLYFGKEKKSLNFIQTMATAFEFFDCYTYIHSQRVTQYAVKLGRQFGFTPSALIKLEHAALIHDIGKLGISYAVLNLKGKLSDQEMKEMRTHSEKGARILSFLGFNRDIVNAVRGHHERYDGKGYPDGLKTDEISLMARILCLADSYDAMTSDRTYKQKLAREAAHEEVLKCNGTQFCPTVTNAFLALYDRQAV